MRVTEKNRNEVIHKLSHKLYKDGKFTNPDQFNAFITGFTFYSKEELQKEVDNVFGDEEL